ncbi:MAG: vitamin K epoxide reductase family protein [Muribaculaceae bacterium]|nr:vitamin K epoxide reductase family protein [Muribaculaceae bacterium]
MTTTLLTFCDFYLSKPNREDLKIFLESSPHYPGLLSVVGMLKYAGVNAQVGKCDWEYLKNMTSPILLHLKLANGEKLEIAKWDLRSNCLKVFKNKGKGWSSVKYNDVCDQWDGVVIYTDMRPNAKLRSDIIGLTSIFAICAIIILLINPTIANNSLLHCLPAIIGCIIGWNLYQKSFGDATGVIQRICHVSSITDCNSVDNSKYSRIIGIQLNCLAFAFYIAQVVCIIIGALCRIANLLHELYLIAAVLTLPLIAYSAYGQYKVRKICPLCIGIAGCIVIESLIFLSSVTATIDYRNIYLFVFIFISTLLILQLIKSMRDKESNMMTDRIASMKIKRKKEIFMMENSQISDIISPIHLGNKNSLYTVTTILSPSCKHCKKLASELISLYQNGQSFRWNIILGSSNPADLTLIDSWIKQYLSDKHKFFEHLKSWSKGEMTPLKPIQGYKDNEATISIITQFFNQKLMELNISSFPQIILNNRLLSSSYSLTDLRYLLADECLTN